MRKSTKLLVLATSLLLVGTGLSVTSAVQCATNNTDLQNTNTQLEEQLKDKDIALDNANAKNDEYKNLIEDYENQLQDYETNKVCGVYFDLRGEILDTEALMVGESVTSTPTVPTSMKNEVQLNGWLLEDGTSVDPLTYVVTDHTTFYADYNLKYKYQFVWQGGGATSSSSYYYLTQITIPETRNGSSARLDDTWVYVGDLINDNLYTSGEVYAFEDVEDHTQVTQVKPLFVKNVIATFEVDGVEYSTQNLSIYNVSSTKNGFSSSAKVDLATLQTPTKEGYTFTGWAIEGAEDTIVDLSTYTFRDNVTFVAVFEEIVE